MSGSPRSEAADLVAGELEGTDLVVAGDSPAMCGLTRTLGRSQSGCVRGERLRFVDVEGGPQSAGAELVDERGGVDRAAAPGVHQERAVRKEAEASRVQQARGAAGQRQDVDDDLGVAEDLVEVGQAPHAVARRPTDADDLDAERPQRSAIAVPIEPRPRMTTRRPDSSGGSISSHSCRSCASRACTSPRCIARIAPTTHSASGMS